MTELELLAPARNAEIGIAAVDCGADAVYIAGPEFGAREAAGNSIDDIAGLCAYAHQFGVKVYMTLNTIIYEKELGKARSLAEAAKEAGADALIAQDLALTGWRPSLPLHASTQCSIRSAEKAVFLEGLGFSRLILERQLSLDQIRKIRKACSCELEFFVHGALCVCYSGQCYLSEFLTGRSANRGECVQACRSLYDLVDEEGKVLAGNKALLSLKDLKLVGKIEELAEAGVSSFKIEGRLKNISYVRNTVRAYSLALDTLVAEQGEKYRRSSFGRVTRGFEPHLDKTFNRGYTELFIDGERGNWAAADTPKGMGEKVGTIACVKYVGRDSMEILVRPSGKAVKSHGKGEPLTLRNGDGFSVTTTEGIIGFRGDVCDGLRIHCKRIEGLREGMTLYRNFSREFEKKMTINPCKREIVVILEARAESPLELIVDAKSEDGREVHTGIKVKESARDTERMGAILEGQLSKSTGIYSFTLKNLQTFGGRLPLISTAQANALRRNLAQKLSELPCVKATLVSGRTQILNRHDDTAKKATTANKALSDSEELLSYKANSANSEAMKVLQVNLGKSPAPAYELSRPKCAELMRSKYCIKFELGLCPSRQGAKPSGKLWLSDKKHFFPLGFDCLKCEMTVGSPVTTLPTQK